MCPSVWANGLWRNASSEEWLSDTIAFAGCYVEALTMTVSAPTVLATGEARAIEIAATSRSGAAVGSANPTSTEAPNGGGCVGVGMWLAAMASFAAVAMSYER